MVVHDLRFFIIEHSFQLFPYMVPISRVPSACLEINSSNEHHSHEHSDARRHARYIRTHMHTHTNATLTHYEHITYRFFRFGGVQLEVSEKIP